MFEKYFEILLAEGLCAEGITHVLVYHVKGAGRTLRRWEVLDVAAWAQACSSAAWSGIPMSRWGSPCKNKVWLGRVMLLALVPTQTPGSFGVSGGMELGRGTLSRVLYLNTLRLKRALNPCHLPSKCSNCWAGLLNAGSSCCLVSKLADGEVGWWSCWHMWGRLSQPNTRWDTAPSGLNTTWTCLPRWEWFWDAHISKMPGW